MTVHCSHDSMCLQCPAESWERSNQRCDVNRHDHSVSWPAITIVTRWRGKDTLWEFRVNAVANRQSRQLYLLLHNFFKKYSTDSLLMMS